MTKFEEEFNYLIELSGKVLIGQVDAEAFEKNRIAFFEKYETDQQQALPVVPEFIGNLINTFGTPEDGKYINYEASYPENQKELDWIDNHQKTWLTALLVGFTVEKPQLFYLKAKELLVVGDYDHVEDLWLDWNKNFTPKKQDAHKFTQQEIDSMQTGSYELVPVEDGE